LPELRPPLTPPMPWRDYLNPWSECPCVACDTLRMMYADPETTNCAAAFGEWMTYQRADSGLDWCGPMRAARWELAKIFRAGGHLPVAFGSRRDKQGLPRD